jgi:hypothetical protein
LQYGRKSTLSKIDIEHAYKIVPIIPSSCHLLGFRLGDKYYFDKTLPIGLSYSCNVFEKCSNAVHWIVENKLGIQGCVHVLDDFLFISPPVIDTCTKSSDLTGFLIFAEKLGIPIKQEKTVFPTTKLTYLGVELDSELMEVRLPQDKLEKLRTILSFFSHRKKITLLELQSLIGLLNFAYAVVYPDRAFLRRIIDLTKGIQKPYHKRRLTKYAKADLTAWSLFIESFNGKGLIKSPQLETSISLHMHTDASNMGFGGFFCTHWFAHDWTPSWLDLHIFVREMYPIILAVELWAGEIQNKHIQFHCDNIAVVYAINKQTAKDPNLMKLVRRLAPIFNVRFEAVHIPGLKNVLADNLSRFQITEFRNLAPHMDKAQTDIAHLVGDL